MASLECSNLDCRKMLGYDCKDNLNIVASSEYSENDCNDTVKIDIKCPRCKRHNILIKE